MFTEIEGFVKAKDIRVGDPADTQGAKFVRVERQGEEIHFVVSNGVEFWKSPDELVFCPRKGRV